MTKKILVVDDDKNMHLYISSALDDKHTILTASTAYEALQIVKTGIDIDLILIDYKLPDLSGIEVLKKIKSLMPTIPILMLTAYGNEEVATRSFRHGARDYIKKPFSYKELISKINFALSLAHIPKSEPRRVLLDTEEQIYAILHSAKNSQRYQRIQKALKHIDTNYMTTLNLSSVAVKAGMSLAHFSRVFKETVGVSYQAYLVQLRINNSKEMLQSSKLSISEIAFSVGFNDLTHFGRMFKKLVGCTPSQYR